MLIKNASSDLSNSQAHPNFFISKLISQNPKIKNESLLKDSLPNLKVNIQNIFANDEKKEKAFQYLIKKSKDKSVNNSADVKNVLSNSVKNEVKKFNPQKVISPYMDKKFKAKPVITPYDISKSNLDIHPIKKENNEKQDDTKNNYRYSGSDKFISEDEPLDQNDIYKENNFWQNSSVFSSLTSNMNKNKNKNKGNKYSYIPLSKLQSGSLSNLNFTQRNRNINKTYDNMNNYSLRNNLSQKVYIRPSIELELNNSSGCIEKQILRRKTFSRNNVKVDHQKQMTKTQISTNANIEVSKNPKIKSEKTYTMSRTSLTTLGASKNEQNYNKNSLWKFFNANVNEKNDRIFNQSITSNNMNTELDNIYEENYRYPIYDWLKEINLHCYYNLFTQKNIFSMDKVIHNLKTGKFNINKSDIEKIGIIIPGHIYRIITKLEIDSGKIRENISNYLIKNKKRMSGRDINIINNSVYFCCGCSGSNEQIHTCTLNRKIFNIDQWLNKIKMIQYKEQFVENGFDFFEYFILQMFSTNPVDDYILREELKIENDKDRDIILLKLNKDVKYIVQKADNLQNENINIYYKGKQCNIEEYEFDSKQKEKDIDCVII